MPLHARRQPFFFNRCGYRHKHDIMVPQVVASAEWEPAAAVANPSPAVSIVYVGRLGKAHVDWPRSRLRIAMWLALRDYPDPAVRFVGTDAEQTVLPYVAGPTNNWCNTTWDVQSGSALFGMHGKCLRMPAGFDPHRSTGKSARSARAVGADLLLCFFFFVACMVLYIYTCTTQ